MLVLAVGITSGRKHLELTLQVDYSRTIGGNAPATIDCDVGSSQHKVVE